MDRVGAGDLGRADDGGNVEVRVHAPRRADANRLVREAHVEAARVRLGKDGDRLDPQLLARPHHAERDLAAIGDQYFSEHQLDAAAFGCARVVNAFAPE
jgi:hypothetical protein